MKPVVLDGHSLTIDDVLAVAYGQPGFPQVAISELAQARVNRAADAVQGLVDQGAVAYGITTGFGAFKDRVIPIEDVGRLQRNILVSHAVGTGDPFDVPTTRAIMLIRANTLASGYSGIRLDTLQRLVNLLNLGVYPLIPEKGSLGASGDLAPLAHMGLILIGEGQAEYQGEILPGAAALRRVGLSPIDLAAKEGLALTNGTTVMCALGMLQSARADRLMRTADVIACLSLEALNGTSLAFDERLHALRPLPRQIDCADYLRKVLAGSQLVRGYDPTNVQDAYTLRCIPQVHGAVRDAVAYALWMMDIELNSVTDNPLIFIDDQTGQVEVISGGNFHGEPLAIAMDYLALAMAELGNMSERRLMRLVDAASNNGVLPAFLTRHGGLNSGFMIVQYTAAALATENKVLAHPASVDTIPTSANVEDHVSMGVTAGLKLRDILDNVEHIIALELFAAAQGIDYRKEVLPPGSRLGRGTQVVYDLVREVVPPIEQDTLMNDHILNIKRLVADGVIADRVSRALG